MNRVALCLLTVLLCCPLAGGQDPTRQRGTGRRASIINRRSRTTGETANVPRSMRVPLDSAKLKQDAETLAQLAQSIPPQVEQTQKGILPADLLDNLKRIEKLARHLRRQLKP